MFKRTLLFFLIFSVGLFSSEIVQAESPPVLTLDEAIHIAFEQNPELKGMQKEIEAAQAKVPQVKSWDDPQIGVRFYQVPWGEGLGKAMDIDYIVSQKIPFPGKKKAASHVAHHESLHHTEDFRLRSRKLLKELKTTYFKLFAVHRELEQSFKLEQLLKLSVRSTEAKISTGKGMATDSIQGQIEFSKLKIERESLIEQKKGLEAELNRILGRSSQESFSLPPRLEIPKTRFSLNELLEWGQTYHASLKQGEHVIEQKQWGLKGAKKEYFPDLTAQLEYVQRPGSAPNAWTGEFMINVPLFVKKKRGGVLQAEAELAGAHYSYSSLKNDLNARIRTAYAKMKSTERIYHLYRDTLLPQTRQGYSLNSLSYSTNQTPFLSLLKSQTDFLEATSKTWKAFEEFSTAVFELEEAVGLTFEEMEQLQQKPIFSSPSKQKEVQP